MSQQTSLSRKVDYSAPPINGDFYRVANLLDDKESAVVKRVRDFMEREIAPIIDDYWARDKFPFEIIPRFAALGIGGIGYRGYGSAGGSMLLNGFISMELARVDSAIGTFWGVHTWPAAGSVFFCGGGEQKPLLRPAVSRVRK